MQCAVYDIVMLLMDTVMMGDIFCKATSKLGRGGQE